MLVHAEIVTIGSELLDGAHADTNSLQLSRWLAELGIPVCAKCVLPDARDTIAEAMRDGLSRSGLVICTGGLGPTWDDCTREAAAEALGSRLRRDPRMLAHLRKRYRGRPMPLANLRQADRLEGASWLHNSCGSAPGQWCPAGEGRVIVLLPGPPRELESMFRQQLRPRLQRLAPSKPAVRMLRVAGLSESAVDDLVGELCRNPTDLQVTILATSEPAVELHLHGQRRAADQLARQLQKRLGSALFSRRPETLAAVVGKQLQEKRQSVAVAESCTGGLVAAQITATAGASGYFSGGIIAYDNEVKRRLLGVPDAVLRRHGAVSAECATAMAQGVRMRLKTDWGISVTGVAGPSGGSVAKPVGTVFIGLSGADGPATVHALRLTGEREVIRRWSAHHALNDLRLRLLGGVN